MAGEWKGQRIVGISDRTCLWLVDSEREAKKRSVKKRGIPPSILQTEFIHVEKFSEKNPTFLSGLLLLWTVTTGNFILFHNKTMNTWCHWIICSSANAHPCYTRLHFFFLCSLKRMVMPTSFIREAFLSHSEIKIEILKNGRGWIWMKGQKTRQETEPTSCCLAIDTGDSYRTQRSKMS